MVTAAARPVVVGPKLTAKDLDPTKFGLKSFDDLFNDLSDGSDGEGHSRGGGGGAVSMNSAQDMITRGASLRTQLQGIKRALERKSEREREMCVCVCSYRSLISRRGSEEARRCRSGTECRAGRFGC